MLPTQRAMWKLCRTLDDPTVLNLGFGLLLDGPFDHGALQWALQELVRRHEPLRTAYAGPADDPVAEVRSDVGLTLDYEDCSGLLGADRVGTLLERCEEALRGRIDAPPLLRARCLLIEPDRHLLLLTFDHLAVDGWSLEVFGREAEQLYAARLARTASPLPPLPPGQLDAVAHDARAWRLGPRAQAEREARRREFARLSPRAVQPFGPETQAPQTLRRRVLAVPGETLARWRASSASSGLTLFPALLAAVAVALCRWLELDEVVLGALVANRHGTSAQRLLGAHYGGTALRVSAPRNAAPQDVMNQVVAQLLGAISHRLDIDALAGILGECAGASGPLVPTCMAVMDRHPLHRLLLEDVTVAPLGTLAVEARRLHEDVDLPMAPAGDIVFFLRHCGDSAGVSVFWNPARVQALDAIVDDVARTLAALGGGLWRGPWEPGSTGAGATGLTPDGWEPTVPAVDALSSLPVLAAAEGGSAP